MSLSRQSVTRRVEGKSEDLQNNLKMDIEKAVVSFPCISMDKLIQWIFSNHRVRKNCILWHEWQGGVCKITIATKRTTTDEDIYQYPVKFAKKISCLLWKIVCIATDGDPAMVGRNNGLLALCQKVKIFLILRQSYVIHNRTHCVLKF